MSVPLVSLSQVSAPGICDWTWELNPGELHVLAMDRGERWSAVAEVLLGRRRPQKGTAQWPMPRQQGMEHRLAERFEHVPFAGQSRAFSTGDYFLGQRYHAGWADEGPSVRQYTGGASPEIRGALELDSLLDRSLISLSSGQMRRARLARALGFQPAAVILEDPLAGLDRLRRAKTASWIGSLCRQGLAAVVLVARQEDFAGAALRLTLRDGRFQRAEPVAERETRAEIPPGEGDSAAGEAVLEFRSVMVRYGANTVIDSFSWTVRRGERWHLAGGNGAGKSTLLALAWGDHPQVFGNDIRLFGRRRGEGQTLWEARRPMTWHAPEVHAHFHEHLSVRQTITTGLTGSFTPPPPGTIDRARLDALMDHFALMEVADEPYRQQPAPIQRMALVGRALFKRAELILLDEPHQGLAPEDRHRVNSWLEKDLQPNQALVFATHETADRPDWLNRSLDMDTLSA